MSHNQSHLSKSLNALSSLNLSDPQRKDFVTDSNKPPPSCFIWYRYCPVRD